MEMPFIPSDEKKKIIIVGAGFAGLRLAKELRKSNFDITLIDKHNFHEFAPLFYQIASSGLEPGAICFPLRKEFKGNKNMHYRMEYLNAIDTSLHQIITKRGNYHYDYLIIACGTVTKFFGMQNIEEHSFTLKTTADGLFLRNQILLCLEKAVTCSDPYSRKKMLTFVISGAGPAGVEIGGALGELKKYVIPREYPELNPNEVQIILMEATDKTLRTMSDEASRKSAQFLQELEVEIRLNTTILDYDGSSIQISTGESIPSDTLIWTAGIEGVKISGLEDSAFGPSNRILVNKYNQLINHPDIFAIGDCCIMITEDNPMGDPQVAQVAIQQATLLAQNLKNGQLNQSFHYNDKGSMATIGRNRAVVDLKYKKFAGRFAWWMWLLVHLVTLVGIRNKIVTIINWIWNYFTYNSSLRLLINPVVRKKRPIPHCENSLENVKNESNL